MPGVTEAIREQAMLCNEAQEHLSAYVDRELTAELSAAVRAHVDACADCRALVEDLRTTSDLLGRLPVRSAPRHVAADVQREIERRMVLEAPATDAAPPAERSLPIHRTRQWPRVLAMAASVALVAGIGMLAYMGSKNLPLPDKPAKTEPMAVASTSSSNGKIAPAPTVELRAGDVASVTDSARKSWASNADQWATLDVKDKNLTSHDVTSRHAGEKLDSMTQTGESFDAKKFEKGTLFADSPPAAGQEEAIGLARAAKQATASRDSIEAAEHNTLARLAPPDVQVNGSGALGIDNIAESKAEITDLPVIAKNGWLAGANSYTGGTAIAAGTLQLRPAADGKAASFDGTSLVLAQTGGHGLETQGVVVNGSIVTFNYGTLSSSSGLTKAGAGTLAIAPTYPGNWWGNGTLTDRTNGTFFAEQDKAQSAPVALFGLSGAVALGGSLSAQTATTLYDRADIGDAYQKDVGGNGDAKTLQEGREGTSNNRAMPKGRAAPATQPEPTALRKPADDPAKVADGTYDYSIVPQAPGTSSGLVSGGATLETAIPKLTKTGPNSAGALNAPPGAGGMPVAVAPPSPKGGGSAMRGTFAPTESLPAPAVPGKADNLQQAVKEAEAKEALREDLQRQLRQVPSISNQVEVRAASAADAEAVLKRLYDDNNWRAARNDKDILAYNDEVLEAPRGDRELPHEKAAAPAGAYMQASTGSEQTWVILADRKSLERFTGQLAESSDLIIDRSTGKDVETLALAQRERLQTALASATRYGGRGGGGSSAGALQPGAPAGAPSGSGSISKVPSTEVAKAAPPTPPALEGEHRVEKTPVTEKGYAATARSSEKTGSIGSGAWAAPTGSLKGAGGAGGTIAQKPTSPVPAITEDSTDSLSPTKNAGSAGDMQKVLTQMFETPAFGDMVLVVIRVRTGLTPADAARINALHFDARQKAAEPHPPAAVTAPKEKPAP
jgi:hypothetical protein